jgi:hypothetical protein
MLLMRLSGGFDCGSLQRFFVTLAAVCCCYDWVLAVVMAVRPSSPCGLQSSVEAQSRVQQPPA